MLKTAKIRPIGGESESEILSQVLSQFAYLVDEVGHLFDVYDRRIKNLEEKIAAAEAVTASDTTEETI